MRQTFSESNTDFKNDWEKPFREFCEASFSEFHFITKRQTFITDSMKAQIQRRDASLNASIVANIDEQPSTLSPASPRSPASPLQSLNMAPYTFDEEDASSTVIAEESVSDSFLNATAAAVAGQYRFGPYGSSPKRPTESVITASTPVIDPVLLELSEASRAQEVSRPQSPPPTSSMSPADFTPNLVPASSASPVVNLPTAQSPPPASAHADSLVTDAFAPCSPPPALAHADLLVTDASAPCSLPLALSHADLLITDASAPCSPPPAPAPAALLTSTTEPSAARDSSPTLAASSISDPSAPCDPSLALAPAALTVSDSFSPHAPSPASSTADLPIMDSSSARNPSPAPSFPDAPPPYEDPAPALNALPSGEVSGPVQMQIASPAMRTSGRARKIKVSGANGTVLDFNLPMLDIIAQIRASKSLPDYFVAAVNYMAGIETDPPVSEMLGALVLFEAKNGFIAGKSVSVAFQIALYETNIQN
jgi:hypothetical protein